MKVEKRKYRGKDQQLDTLLSSMNELQLFEQNKASRNINRKLGKRVINAGRDSKMNRVYKYAAVLSLFLVSAFVINFYVLSKQHINNNDESIALILRDNSEIILNHDASIKFKKSFSVFNRKLELSGDALFNVSPDPDLPFVIDVGTCRITVLGTSFVVEQTEGGDVRLDVKEGKVKIEHEGRIVELMQGQKWSSKEVEIEDYASYSWLPEPLIINNLSITDAIEVVNNEYGREVIKLMDKENGKVCRIRTEFRPGELDVFLNELEILFKIKLRSYKGSFAIDEINCNS